MKKTLIFSVLILAAACLAADLPVSPDAKSAKTKLKVMCPKCDVIITATVPGRDVRCYGSRAVTNGYVAQYTANVKCPTCKTKFDSKFEQFKKAPPTAVVVP